MSTNQNSWDPIWFSPLTEEQTVKVSEERYEQQLTCENCSKTLRVFILKKMLVKDVIKHVDCPNCGVSL
jgi:transcription elongation factor Elf1